MIKADVCIKSYDGEHDLLLERVEFVVLPRIDESLQLCSTQKNFLVRDIQHSIVNGKQYITIYVIELK